MQRQGVTAGRAVSVAARAKSVNAFIQSAHSNIPAEQLVANNMVLQAQVMFFSLFCFFIEVQIMPIMISCIFDGKKISFFAHGPQNIYIL